MYPLVVDFLSVTVEVTVVVPGVVVVGSDLVAVVEETFKGNGSGLQSE